MDDDNSPFMRPEFVLHDAEDHGQDFLALQNPPDGNQLASCIQQARSDMQQRLLNRHQNSSRSGRSPMRPASNCSARPCSPFLKPPQVITNAGDNSLYVKVEDLPEDVREQVRGAMALDAGLGNRDENVTAATGNSGAADDHDEKSKLPFSEPIRLSAQPTIEEIQMCFAQVDLAILMETKPTTRMAHLNAGAPPSASSRSASHAKLSAMADGRRSAAAHSRDRQPASPPPPSLYQYTSDSNSSIPLFQSNENPTSAFALGTSIPNAEPTSRMQQLLIELANSRRNSASATASIIHRNDTDTDMRMSGESGGIKRGQASEALSWPPFAVSASERTRKSTELIKQETLSLLEDDFVHKLEQIQALAETGQAAPIRSEDNDKAMRASNSSSSRNVEIKRAYQLPVWTHGGNPSAAATNCGGQMQRYQGSWSGRSGEEYEIMDPDHDVAHVGTSRGGSRRRHRRPMPMSSRALETSTDTES